MEFFRQEYWSGLPFPSSGDLPDPGIEPGSPALQADTLPSEPPPDYSKNNQVARINSNPFQRDHTKTTKILENKKEIPNRAWWVTAMTVEKKN